MVAPRVIAILIEITRLLQIVALNCTWLWHVYLLLRNNKSNWKFTKLHNTYTTLNYLKNICIEYSFYALPAAERYPKLPTLKNSFTIVTNTFIYFFKKKMHKIWQSLICWFYLKFAIPFCTSDFNKDTVISIFNLKQVKELVVRSFASRVVWYIQSPFKYSQGWQGEGMRTG